MSSWEQPGFDFASPPAARSTDPDTSHLAAKLPGRGQGKARVLNALIREPLTDEDIATVTKMEKGTASKRRGDCVKAGWVTHLLGPDGVPRRGETRSGSPAFVWCITDEGRRAWALIHRET